MSAASAFPAFVRVHPVQPPRMHLLLMCNRVRFKLSLFAIGDDIECDNTENKLLCSFAGTDINCQCDHDSLLGC